MSGHEVIYQPVEQGQLDLAQQRHQHHYKDYLQDTDITN